MCQDVPNNEILEELFQMFNLSRPQDFEGHSLSVSDVIALKRNGEVSEMCIRDRRIVFS